MTHVPPPPWQGRTAEPERTPEGEEIVQTRFGPHVRLPNGSFIPWASPEDLAARHLRKPRRPATTADWSPWDH
jgi:hypothetical protein